MPENLTRSVGWVQPGADGYFVSGEYPCFLAWMHCQTESVSVLATSTLKGSGSMIQIELKHSCAESPRAQWFNDSPVTGLLDLRRSTLSSRKPNGYGLGISSRQKILQNTGTINGPHSSPATATDRTQLAQAKYRSPSQHQGINISCCFSKNVL